MATSQHTAKPETQKRARRYRCSYCADLHMERTIFHKVCPECLLIWIALAESKQGRSMSIEQREAAVMAIIRGPLH